MLTDRNNGLSKGKLNRIDNMRWRIFYRSHDGQGGVAFYNNLCRSTWPRSLPKHGRRAVMAGSPADLAELRKGAGRDGRLFDVKSAPRGAPLLAAVADHVGFRNTSLTMPPPNEMGYTPFGNRNRFRGGGSKLRGAGGASWRHRAGRWLLHRQYADLHGHFIQPKQKLRRPGGGFGHVTTDRVAAERKHSLLLDRPGRLVDEVDWSAFGLAKLRCYRLGGVRSVKYQMTGSAREYWHSQSPRRTSSSPARKKTPDLHLKGGGFPNVRRCVTDHPTCSEAAVSLTRAWDLISSRKLPGRAASRRIMVAEIPSVASSRTIRSTL